MVGLTISESRMNTTKKEGMIALLIILLSLIGIAICIFAVAKLYQAKEQSRWEYYYDNPARGSFHDK